MICTANFDATVSTITVLCGVDVQPIVRLPYDCHCNSTYDLSYGLSYNKPLRLWLLLQPETSSGVSTVKFWPVKALNVSYFSFYIYISLLLDWVTVGIIYKRLPFFGYSELFSEIEFLFFGLNSSIDIERSSNKWKIRTRIPRTRIQSTDTFVFLDIVRLYRCTISPPNDVWQKEKCR